MKNLTALGLAAVISIALPALAQESSYSDDSTDRSDHYNNQSSIVPDTVPDSVHHNTVHGQVAADQAKLAADQKDLQAHKAHEYEQMKKDDRDLSGSHAATTPGHTPPIVTQ